MNSASQKTRVRGSSFAKLLTLNPLEGQLRSWVRRRARGLNTFCCSLPTELAVALLGGPEARQCCSGQPYCYPTPYLPFFPSLFLLNEFPTLSQSAPEMLFIFFLFFYFFFKFYFIFKLNITVLDLPNIKMNPPQVYMCSPS